MNTTAKLERQSVACIGGVSICLLLLFGAEVAVFADQPYRTIALSGTDGPLGPGLGSGEVYRAVFEASINNAGTVVFGALLVDPAQTFDDDFGLWIHDGTANNIVVREGDIGSLGPGLGPTETFESAANAHINGARDLAFFSHLTDVNPFSRPGGFWRRIGNVINAEALEAVEGPLGPNLGDGITFDEFNPVGNPTFNDRGDIAFSADLLGVGNTPKVRGLWLNTGGLNMPIAQGATSGALGPNLGGGEQFDAFLVSGGPALQSNGDVIFTAFLFQSSPGVMVNNDRGIFRHTGGANQVVAREGAAGALGPGLGAGIVFDDMDAPSVVNDAGSVAFNSYLRGTGVTSANRRGIFVNQSGTNAIRARTGATGALGPGLPGTVFTDLLSPIITGTDEVFFAGFISGTPNSRLGLWRNVGGENQSIALAGDVATLGPGLGPNISFRTFELPEANALGQAVFGAYLSGTGVDMTNDYGLWAYAADRLWLIARTGDLFDIDPSANLDLRTIRSAALVGVAGGALPSGGQDGRVRALNDSGVVVFRLGFTDGSDGIFTMALVPEPQSASLLVTAIALVGQVQRRRRCERRRG